MSRFALVTPSYLPDLERCALLAESVARFASSDFEHVVIVPHADQRAFVQRLGQFGVAVLLQEEVIGVPLVPVPFMPKWQLSLSGWPVRGWIRQQVVKLSYACLSTADALLMVDSDTCFVRPFDKSLVVREDGRMRLLCEPGVGDQDPHHRWYRRAASLLGIPLRDYFGNGFIGQLETWVPRHARAAMARVEEVTSRNWKRVLLHQLTISEYVLYGVYVQEVLGFDASQHFPDQRPNPVLQHYNGELSDAALKKFLGGLADHHLAILIQSTAEYPFDQYAATVRQSWGTSGQ